MFCETCHWYTRGEAVCPHCGAPQAPEEVCDITNLLEDTSAPEPAAIGEPLAPAAPPAMEDPPAMEAPAPPAPVPPRAPAPKAQTPSPLPPMPPPGARPVPKPKPAYSAPKPAYTLPKPAKPFAGSNKQDFLVLALVLAGVTVLVIIIIFSELAGRNVRYVGGSNYGDAYYVDDSDADDFYYEVTEPALEAAQAGDAVTFGSAQWQVLEVNMPDVLLLQEYETFLPPEEVGDYLSESDVYDGSVWLGGVEFTAEEFHRLRMWPDGSSMSLLTSEQLEAYGVQPPESRDDGLVSVRPAIWVSVW